MFYTKSIWGIDWKNPTDINEKINYLKFYSDITEWTRLADKYRVREFVKERGLEEILVPLLGVWSKPEEICYESLPNSFVLKTNNGAGSVILVEDKRKMDLNVVNDKLELA